MKGTIMAECNIGIVGAGTVGGGVIKIYNTQKSFFADKLGLSLALKRIVDKETGLFNNLPVGEAICTDNVEDILGDADIHIVVELIGGTVLPKTSRIAWSSIRSPRGVDVPWAFI